jgi:hypothetical protein
MKPIAVILVASGQGLIAVIKPKTIAESHGIVLFSKRLAKKSIRAWG